MLACLGHSYIPLMHVGPREWAAEHQDTIHAHPRLQILAINRCVLESRKHACLIKAFSGTVCVASNSYYSHFHCLDIASCLQIGSFQVARYNVCHLEHCECWVWSLKRFLQSKRQPKDCEALHSDSPAFKKIISSGSKKAGSNTVRQHNDVSPSANTLGRQPALRLPVLSLCSHRRL